MSGYFCRDGLLQGVSHQRHFQLQDHVSNAANITWRKPRTKSARTAEIGPELLIECAEGGTTLEIEAVSPGFVTVGKIAAAFERLGLEPPPTHELAPPPNETL